MIKKCLVVFAVATLAGCSANLPPLKDHGGNNFCMKMVTTLGEIDLLINAEKAPISAQNFLDYANSGHYGNTVFHRVIKGYMIQAGGHTADLAKKETRAPIKNESGNGLSNTRGSIAMARARALDSATSQFFINHKDNSRLDQMRYTVFGEVVAGIEVVDAIANVETGYQNGKPNVPVTPITITAVERIRCPEGQ